jgi:hypothetical protein
VDQAIRRKTLKDFRAELKSCTDAAAARDLVAQARVALTLNDYRELQREYRAAWES